MSIQEPRPTTHCGNPENGGCRQEERWLTLADASSHVQLHPATLRRAVRRGDLTAFRVNRGRVYRIRVADLDRYMEQGKVLDRVKAVRR